MKVKKNLVYFYIFGYLLEKNLVYFYIFGYLLELRIESGDIEIGLIKNQ